MKVVFLYFLLLLLVAIGLIDFSTEARVVSIEPADIEQFLAKVKKFRKKFVKKPKRLKRKTTKRTKKQPNSNCYYDNERKKRQCLDQGYLSCSGFILTQKLICENNVIEDMI